MNKREYKVVSLRNGYSLEWVVYKRRWFFWKETLRTDNWSDVTALVHADLVMDELQELKQEKAYSK